MEESGSSILGVPEPYGNHAKIGVSTDGKKPLCIFGDMNQMGTLNPRKDLKDIAGKPALCNVHQNGRGGLFYVVENKELFKSITDLLDGDVAPLLAPPVKPKKKVAAKKATVKKAIAKKSTARKAISKKVTPKKVVAKPQQKAVKKAVAKKAH
jgi:hypothetical protein